MLTILTRRNGLSAVQNDTERYELPSLCVRFCMSVTQGNIFTTKLNKNSAFFGKTREIFVVDRDRCHIRNGLTTPQSLRQLRSVLYAQHTPLSNGLCR